MERVQAGITRFTDVYEREGQAMLAASSQSRPSAATVAMQRLKIQEARLSPDQRAALSDAFTENERVADAYLAIEDAEDREAWVNRRLARLAKDLQEPWLDPLYVGDLGFMS
jgi:hypothetical protein